MIEHQYSFRVCTLILTRWVLYIIPITQNITRLPVGNCSAALAFLTNRLKRLGNAPGCRYEI
jgi:hypothetical protein